MTPEDLDNRFSYHAPNDLTKQLHEIIRNDAKMVANSWNGKLPESREKSLAITHLEEAMFWANAALARNS